MLWAPETRLEAAKPVHNRKDPPRIAPGGSFRLAVGIGLRLSTLVASANQLDSVSSDASIRAEALSLSHLTWCTTVTIRFHRRRINLLSSVWRQYHSANESVKLSVGRAVYDS